MSLNDLCFLIYYSSSWEIPALNSGKFSIVSDSDGISYPWYGNSTEIATIVGPTDAFTRLHLSVSSIEMLTVKGRNN